MGSSDAEFRCFVGGLAWATDDQALEKAFGAFGNVTESKIINDLETGRSRGFGFVTFGDEKSMRDAIEGMNGQDLDGRNITVNEAQSRGSGGGGGGDGYRGYGASGGGRRDRGFSGHRYPVDPSSWAVEASEGTEMFVHKDLGPKPKPVGESNGSGENST